VAWREWERSCQPAETVTVVRRVRPPSAQRQQDEPVNEYEAVPGEPSLVEEVTTRRAEGRVGDAALARVVLNLIVEEEELLGIKARPGEQTTAPGVVKFKIICPPDQPGEDAGGTAARPQPQLGLKELVPGAAPDDNEPVETGEGDSGGAAAAGGDGEDLADEGAPPG
jgi:hypothetical protein